MGRVRLVLAVLACAALLVLAVPSGPSDAAAASLRRYPYLTDLVTTNVTINWATTAAVSAGSATYGAVGTESLHRAHRGGDLDADHGRYRRRAPVEGAADRSQSRHRLLLPDLLRARPTCWRATRAHRSRRRSPAGSNTPFSFAVLGDWGQVNAKRQERRTRRALWRRSRRAARASPSPPATMPTRPGTQPNYGDLQQTGQGHEHDLRPGVLDGGGSTRSRCSTPRATTV